MLCSGSTSWSAKPDVQGNACRGDVRVHPVKHHLMIFILVKAEIEECAHGTAGLRHAVHDGFLNGPGEWVFWAGIVAQKRGEIAHRREAEPEHCRVFCRIDQLVDVIRVKPAIETDLRSARSAWKRRCRAVGESPLAVRNQLTRIILMHALGQDGPRVGEGDALITRGGGAGIRSPTEILRCCRASGEPILGAHAPDDGSTTAVMRNRYGHRQPVVTGEHVALPAARDHYETLAM